MDLVAEVRDLLNKEFSFTMGEIMDIYPLPGRDDFVGITTTWVDPANDHIQVYICRKGDGYLITEDTVADFLVTTMSGGCLQVKGLSRFSSPEELGKSLWEFLKIVIDTYQYLDLETADEKK
jgi:hypothetical protein